MFEKKLSKKDLEESRERAKLINQCKLIVDALEVQNRVYLKGILPKYGLDMNKDYAIDLDTNKITEIKQKELKEEK